MKKQKRLIQIAEERFNIEKSRIFQENSIKILEFYEGI
jgi:hypothetical protein